jgi:hypothetical protein
MKTCNVCKQDKELNEFNANKSKPDGLQSKCKECGKRLAKEYQRDRMVALGRVCRVCNTRKSSECFQLIRGLYWKRICNECLYKTRTAEWTQEDREQRNRYNRERTRGYRRDPSKTARHVFSDSRKSDKKKGFVCDLTLDVVKEMISRECAYCGDTEIRMSLDRIDNTIGHTVRNVVPACLRCNFARGGMPYEAWLCLVPGLKEARKRGLFGDWLGKAGLVCTGR